VLAAVRRAGQGLAQLTGSLGMLPQHLVNVRIQPGFDWNAHGPLQRELAAARKELEGAGRVLIRPSGTEPVLRVMVEAQDDAAARRLAQRLAESVR